MKKQTNEEKFNFKSYLVNIFKPNHKNNMELLDNIKILTQNKLDIKDLKLKGIKLGDNYKLIDKNEIKSIGTEDNRWISVKNEILFRTLNVKTEKIIEFVIFNKELIKQLKVKTEKDILRKFGKPDELNKEHGLHQYFYQQKKIVITWSDFSKEIYRISIGESSIKPKKYTARDFLEKFIEFKSYVSNPRNWNEKHLLYNPPRLYRFLELKSLIKAFDIGTDLLEDFQNKGFLEKRKIEDFEHIYENIAKYASESELEKELGYKEELEQMKYRRNGGITMIFQSFLHFVEVMTNTLAFNRNWLEAGSVSSRYNIDKTKNALETFDISKLEEIKEILVLVIDPKNKVFTRRELIEKFDFPDVDLKRIDADWA